MQNTEVVDAARFAAARAREIKTLSQEIAAGKGGHVRAMQLLPHHKQRREMSTTPNRLPRRLREQGKRELEGTTVREAEKHHRKHRRRPKYLMDDHARRQEEFVWLETHIWHAKRFKMIKLWGFHIAKHPHDRATRAAYKALRRTCLLYDASHERTLRVTGPADALMNLLKRCSDPNVSAWANAMYMGGARVGHCFVHHPGCYPHRPIAPVRFLWLGTGDVILWVHPSAAQEMCLALADNEEEVSVALVDSVAQFDVLGPRAHSILQRLLHPTGNAHPWLSLAGVGDAASLPSNMVLSMSVSDPRLASTHSVRAAAFSPPSLEVLRDLVRAGAAAQAMPLWEGTSPLPEPQVELDARRGKGRLAEPRSEATVLLIQVPATRQGLGAGYRLVVSRPWAMSFWLMLSGNGGHSVGLADMDALSRQELGRPVFPNDFPDTEAGRVHCAYRASRELAKWLRRPPAKRSPYFVGDASPFVVAAPSSCAGLPAVLRSSAAVPALPSLLVPVTISMEGRGSITACASLYSMDVSERIVEPSYRPLRPDEPQARIDAILERWRSGLGGDVDAEEGRVGVAHGGGVSMLRGFGFGVGLLNWNALEGNESKRVWVRNMGSRICFQAIARRCE